MPKETDIVHVGRGKPVEEVVLHPHYRIDWAALGTVLSWVFGIGAVAGILWTLSWWFQVIYTPDGAVIPAKHIFATAFFGVLAVLVLHDPVVLFVRKVTKTVWR